MTKHTDRIESLWNLYCRDVQKVINELQSTIINPWLEHMGYYMICGNGDYFVGWDIPDPKSGEWEHGKTKIFNEADLPKYIRDILELEIPGMPGNSAGTLMTNYKATVTRYKLLKQRKQMKKGATS